jgi:hypothetical protein
MPVSFDLSEILTPEAITIVRWASGVHAVLFTGNTFVNLIFRGSAIVCHGFRDIKALGRWRGGVD